MKFRHICEQPKAGDHVRW